MGRKVEQTAWETLVTFPAYLGLVVWFTWSVVTGDDDVPAVVTIWAAIGGAVVIVVGLRQLARWWRAR